MEIFPLLLLAIIQGITEFLPISSSAHLELIHKYFGETPDDLALDVAVHIGTLGAVIIYFRTDVQRAFFGFISLCRGRIEDPRIHLALCLIIATIPVVILGLLIKLAGFDEMLRSLAVMGWAMIIFGVLLWWADRNPKAEKTTEAWTMKDAVKLGLWQAIALIPGTSRSGITITGALQLGYTRHDAARIAMLMSIPTILASAALLSVDVVAEANWQVLRSAAIAALLSFGAAYLALGLMMRLLQSISYTPYVIYRLILGAAILVVAYN